MPEIKDIKQLIAKLPEIMQLVEAKYSKVIRAMRGAIFIYRSRNVF